MSNPGQDLSEIRAMMEKSSRILSLSGVAGIVIGCVALVGVLYAEYISAWIDPDDQLPHFLADALIVLLLAIILVVVFSTRMAKKKELPAWNPAAKNLVTELAVPLATGGAFCIALILGQVYSLLPSAMLLFYGLALFGASKYTIPEVRWLGIAQVVLGLLAAFMPAQGLLYWALGFGIAHMLFGLRIYFMYER